MWHFSPCVGGEATPPSSRLYLNRSILDQRAQYSQHAIAHTLAIRAGRARGYILHYLGHTELPARVCTN